MKNLIAFGLAVATLASTALAESVKSGPQAGDDVGAFTVVKVAGNANDGVKEGEKLCYRCKMGNRPVVAVFARNTDTAVADLVKKLDAVSADNSEKNFVAYVNLLGDDAGKLKKNAQELVEKSGAKNIAVVVPKEHTTGPQNYHINPQADVTVVIYKSGTVAANHAVSGELSGDEIAQIVKDTDKILR